MLLEHPGELVTREEVHQKLWPNGTIVEFDHSINAAIKRLRQALEDSAEAPRYIETLPRLGYRFIGPVEQGLSDDYVPPEKLEAKSSERDGEIVSHYRIQEKIGGGGMGVVYRAEDTRLGRIVALKFLPDVFSDDKASLERFRREGYAASALNHPNICTLYDVGQIDGRPFLAMEFLEGQTLLQLMAAAPMATDTICEVGIQIADALDAAHAKGIVHRDIKPSNIFVTARGPVKVMDFGLAKLARGQVSFFPKSVGSEELRTSAGSPVGTVAYMSPEQARGEDIDARTDLFSFGVVLYEMVTGQRPFQGETTAVIFDAILNKAPLPPVHLRPELPAELEAIIYKALEKDREVRCQTASELRADLRRLKRDTASDKSATFAGSAPSDPDALVQGSAARSAAKPISRRHRWPLIAGGIIGSDEHLGLHPSVQKAARFGPRFWLTGALGVLLGFLLMLGGVFIRKPRQAALQSGPTLTRLTSDAGLTTDPAFSPDGKLLAYASDHSSSGFEIWMRQVSGGEPLQLTHDGFDNREPSFSADGSMVVFSSKRAGGGIYVMPVLGGDPQRIASEGRRPRFSPDGKLVAYWVGSNIDIGPQNSQGVALVPATGGPARMITSGFLVARSPVWSPDGKHLLFLGAKRVAAYQYGDNFDWWIAPVAGGSPEPLHLRDKQRLAEMYYPEPWVWTADQQIIFTGSSGATTNTWRIPIAADGSRLAGPAERMTVSEGGETALSWVGSRLAFASEKREIDLWSLEADTNHGLARLEMQRLTADAGSNYYPAATGNGRRLVFLSDRRGPSEVWLKDFALGTEKPIFGSADSGHLPSISSDGSTVIYSASDGNRLANFLLNIGADGSFGVPRRFCAECGNPWTSSSDARILLYSTNPPQRAIFALSIDSGEKRLALLAAEPMLSRPRFSPDDKWIAFSQRSEAAWRIYVAQYDGTVKKEDQWIAITDGRFAELIPHWSPSGDLLYFYSERDGSLCIWAQRLDAQSKRPVGTPFAVKHFHEAGRSLKNVPLIELGMSLTPDRIILNQGEAKGNIWMADYSSKEP